MMIPFLPFAVFTAGITIYSAFFYDPLYCPKEWMLQIANCEPKIIGQNIRTWAIKDTAIEKYEQLQMEKRLKIIKDNQ
ncbi:MAG: hypothetical protein CXT73_05785 [Methanobacteriota archaeon]|nr:MAG: hypothetical protein CXT73_05785 [Euryarchaeota archaeon]